MILGHLGEGVAWNDGSTIVQKTHDAGEDHIAEFNRTGILMIRNPYKAILSFHNYLYGGHTGFSPTANYLKKGNLQLITKLTRQSKKYAEDPRHTAVFRG